MNVLSFDPGETIGYAVLDHIEKEMPLLANFGVLNQLPEVWEILEDYGAGDEDILVVYEGFNLHSHRAQSQIGSDFFTVKVIGVIDLWTELTDTTTIVQTPAVGKSIWTDDKLRSYEYYVQNKHTRDAIRHALHALQIHRLPEVREHWND